MLIIDCLNRLISLDPNATKTLQPLEGKIILISLERINTPWLFFITFEQHGIAVASTIERTPDATIFIRHSTRDISLEGDIELLERVHHFIFSLNIDWEEWLSQWVGDGISYQVGRFFKSLYQKPATFLEQLSLMATEYFSEEAKLFPTTAEIEHYLEEVDILQSAVERLKIRVQALC